MADDTDAPTGPKKPGIIRRASGRIVGAALGNNSLSHAIEGAVAGRRPRTTYYNQEGERRAPPGIARRVAASVVGAAMGGEFGALGNSITNSIRYGGGNKKVPGTNGKHAEPASGNAADPELHAATVQIAEDINTLREDVESGLNFLYKEIQTTNKAIDNLRRDMTKVDTNASKKRLNNQMRDSKGRYAKASNAGTTSIGAGAAANAAGQFNPNGNRPPEDGGGPYSDFMDMIKRHGPTAAGGAAATGAAGYTAKRLLQRGAYRVGAAAGGALRAAGPLGAVVGGTIAMRDTQAGKDKMYADETKKFGKTSADQRKSMRSYGLTGWLNDRMDDAYEKITGSGKKSDDATKSSPDTADGVSVETKKDISFTTTMDIRMKADEINFTAKRIKFDAKDITINGKPLSGYGGNDQTPPQTKKQAEIEDVQKNGAFGALRSLGRQMGFNTPAPGSVGLPDGTGGGDGGAPIVNRNPRMGGWNRPGGGSSAAPSGSGGGGKLTPGNMSSDGDVTQRGDGLRTGVYNAFRNAGYSHEGALTMSGEVNRENGFNPDLVYGTHTDPHNKATNSGMFSWQGSRSTALMDHMRANDALDENGKIKRDQKSLDLMAKFARSEMDQGQYGGGRLNKALEGSGFDRSALADDIGKNYIKWRVDDPQYREGGIRNREQGYAATEAAVARSKSQGDAGKVERDAPSKSNVIEAVTDQQRDYHNTGRISLRDPQTGQVLGNYRFGTGGGGKGSLPTGQYDVDPSMMPAGNGMSDRFKLLKGKSDYGTQDPGIPGATGPSSRGEFRIHSSDSGYTLGCVGIMGGDRVYADFKKNLLLVQQKSGGAPLSLRIGTPEALATMAKMDTSAPGVTQSLSNAQKDKLTGGNPEVVGSQTPDASPAAYNPGSPASWSKGEGRIAPHIDESGKLGTMATSFGRSDIIKGFGDNFSKLPKDVQDHLKNDSQLDMNRLAPHAKLMPKAMREGFEKEGLTFKDAVPASGTPPGQAAIKKEAASIGAKALASAGDESAGLDTSARKKDSLDLGAGDLDAQLSKNDAAAAERDKAGHAIPAEQKSAAPISGAGTEELDAQQSQADAQFKDSIPTPPEALTQRSGEEVTADVKSSAGSGTVGEDKVADSGGLQSRGSSSSSGSLRAPTHHPESERPTPGSDGYGDEVCNPDGGGLCAV